MLSSLIITGNKNKQQLADMFQGNSSVYFADVKGYSLAIEMLDKDGSGHPENNFVEIDGISYVLSGEVFNIDELKETAKKNGVELKGSPTVTQVITGLYRKIGSDVFKVLEGSFSFAQINQDGSLRIFRDAVGFMPVNYYNKDGDLWIANEAKNLARNPNIDLSLLPKADFQLRTKNADDFSVFRNVRKLAPGSELKVQDGEIATHRYYAMKQGSATSPADMKEAKDALNAALTRSVSLAIAKEGATVIPLSGGVDSSAVLAMAKRQGADLHSVSMGTTSANELAEAKLASNYVGSQHHELMLDDTAVMQGLVKAIYDGEVFDSYAAEVLAPMSALYSEAAKYGDRVVTGYGADLLFGGIYPPDTDLSTLNDRLWDETCRTRWSGEFSPFFAARHGVSVAHPFWNKDVMELAFSIPSEQKIAGGEIKAVLREMVLEEGYLPREVAYRTKIGIHQASAITSIFSRYLGLESNGAHPRKEAFVYEVYRQLFDERKSLNEINTRAIADKVIAEVPLTNVVLISAKAQEPLILKENRNGVLVLTLNHPTKTNPYSLELRQALQVALMEADADISVDSIVLYGGKGRSFCAGGDFNEVRQFRGGPEVNQWIDGIIDLYQTMLRVSKPTVAAIDEHAIGVGFQVATLFDMRYGTPETKFQMPELVHGISCTLGGSMLERYIGHVEMKQVLFEGRPILAEEALKTNLLTHIVPKEDLLDKAIDQARLLASYPQVAYRITKQGLNENFIADLQANRSVSIAAHRASFGVGGPQTRFKNILGDKYVADPTRNELERGDYNVSFVRPGYGLVIQPGASRDIPAFDKQIGHQLYKNGFVVLRGFEVGGNEATEWFRRIAAPIPYKFGEILEMTPKPDSGQSQFTNAGMSIHQDTILNDGAKANMLSFYCSKAPAPGTGGETLLVDNRALLKALPPKIMDFLRTAQIEYETMSGGYYAGSGVVTVPAITPHPVTGEEVLFMGLNDFKDPQRNFKSKFAGMTEEKSDQMMAALDGYMRHPSIVYQHRWQEGDILLLENFLVSHGRNPFELGQERKLLRVSAVYDYSKEVLLGNDLAPDMSQSVARRINQKQSDQSKQQG